MDATATFAEVLDDILRAGQPEAAAPDNQPRFRPAPLHPFLFSPMYDRAAGPLMWGRGSAPAIQAVASPVASTPEPAAAATAVRVPARPPRRLTSHQQRSLDAFIELGAAMRANFSAQELRSAFRALARRYHPDRHPFVSDSDKTTLSRQFTAITTHYDTLLTALGPTSVS